MNRIYCLVLLVILDTVSLTAQLSKKNTWSLPSVAQKRVARALCEPEYADPESIKLTKKYFKNLQESDVEYTYVVRHRDNPMMGYLVLEIPIILTRNEKKDAKTGAVVGSVDGSNPYRFIRKKKT